MKVHPGELAGPNLQRLGRIPPPNRRRFDFFAFRAFQSHTPTGLAESIYLPILPGIVCTQALLRFADELRVKTKERLTAGTFFDALVNVITAGCSKWLQALGESLQMRLFGRYTRSGFQPFRGLKSW